LKLKHNQRYRNPAFAAAQHTDSVQPLPKHSGFGDIMKKISFLCATAALVTPVAIYAQETTGTIRGEVTANGAPVGGAQVVIVNVPSGTTSTVTADAQGNFSAAGPSPGWSIPHHGQCGRLP
jgi:hypothetical protein